MKSIYLNNSYLVYNMSLSLIQILYAVFHTLSQMHLKHKTCWSDKMDSHTSLKMYIDLLLVAIIIIYK